jgi:hypothetical protein
MDNADKMSHACANNYLRHKDARFQSVGHSDDNGIVKFFATKPGI